MRTLRTVSLLLVLCGLAFGCASSESPRSAHAATGDDAKLEAVARVHGGAGPWAVAGYRMGERALTLLGLERGSFDVEVVHYTPQEVQYSCIADGASAATGASVGKLNLSLVDAPAADTHTRYTNRKTGAIITLRLTKAFTERFKDVPMERLSAAGREVVVLPDDDIFERVGD